MGNFLKEELDVKDLPHLTSSKIDKILPPIGPQTRLEAYLKFFISSDEKKTQKERGEKGIEKYCRWAEAFMRRSDL